MNLGRVGTETVDARRREAAVVIDRIKRGEDPRPAPEPIVADLAERCLKNHVDACLVNPGSAAIDGSSKLRLDYWIGRELFATTIDFQTQFSICDFVAFPGFPPWHDQRQHRPILRTGKLSSDPRYDYSWSTEYKGECIAFEALSYGGSPGSPVIAVRKVPKPGAGISILGSGISRL